MSGAANKGLPARIEIAMALTALLGRPEGPILPFTTAVEFDQAGYAWFDALDGEGDRMGCYAHAGLRLGWFDIGDPRGALISLLGGPGAEDGFEEEGILAFITGQGLRALISDLQSIADQLSDCEQKIFPGGHDG
jgi:hypothetical protein